jgi:spore germination protein (amino acid permease)
MKTNDKISINQLYFLLLQTQIGVGLLSLPSTLHQDAKGDGWISVLLSGFVVLIITTIICALCKRYPSETIFDFSKKIVGKFFGSVINLLYICYFLCISVLIVHLSSSVVKKWVLALTPHWVLIVLFIFVGIYLGREKLKIIARFFVFETALVFILLLLSIGTYTDVNFKYIFPVGQAGIKNIIIGSHDSLISMLGFEMLLAVYPFVAAKERQILKYASLSIITTTVLYAFFTFTSYIVFSPEEITLLPEPILYMLKALHYELIERLDLVFIVIWIVPMTTSLVAYLYLSSVGISKMIRKKDHKKTSTFVGFIVLIMSVLIPSSEEFVQKVNTIISYSSYAFIAVIPLFLFLLSLIKSFFKEKNHEA